MQEEVENRTVNLAISTTKLTLRTLYKGILKAVALYKKWQADQEAGITDKPTGKQSIEELIGQNQGVTSVDVAKTDLKGFEKYARQFNVDYAIVKDKSAEIPKYLCFFKARDSDAITACFNAYMADMKKNKERPSVLKTLEKLKALVPLPGRDKVRQKERTQDR